MQNDFKKSRDKQLEYKDKLENLKSVLLSIENSDNQKIKERFTNSGLLKEIEGIIKKLNDSNLSISIIAEVSNGKSTFLNSLIFKENILDSGAGAVTARIFKIGYGDDYSVSVNNNKKSFQNIDNLKNAVKNLNKNTREKIDNKNSNNNDFEEVEINLPHKALKDGIVVYDTPGFGALDEEIVFPLIEKVVNKSDAVIMLLDISSGLKKGEDKFVKTTLKSIDSEKRFIIFNKYDAVVNEDQKILMSEEEIQEQLEKVTNETLENLTEISNIKKDEIDYYLLSAQKALDGYSDNDKQALEDSNFKEFEDKFWKKIINSKEEIFENRIKNSIQKIDNFQYILNQLSTNTNEQIKQLENLVNGMIEKNAEFSAFAKSSISSLQKLINEFQNDKNINFDLDSLLDEIGKIIKQRIFDSLEEISDLDKIKLWSLKNKYFEKIENALEDSEELIKDAIIEYINIIHNNLYDAQEKLNINIDNINSKILDNYEDLNIELLKMINILNKNINGNIEININSNFIEHISIDKEAFVIIGGLIAEFIATRFALIIPGIGLIISGIIYTFMKTYKKNNNPNEELASKVTEEVKIKLKKELTDKLEKYKTQTNRIKNAMSSSLFDGKDKLEYIKKSLEDPSIKQKEIIKLNKTLTDIEQYSQKIEKLKG